MTRAAVKRKASTAFATADEITVSKKRVVLGELTNVVVPNQEREIHKPKSTLIPAKKQTKNAPIPPPPPALDFESGSVDPQMCGPYVADICAYLREMEVNNSSLLLHVMLNDCFVFYFV